MRSIRARYLAPMLESNISRKIFLEEYDNSRTSSIGSNDAVIILNPTKYTLNEEVYDENILEDKEDKPSF